MSRRLENMVDAVLPAPPIIEAFVKGFTEPVEARPADDLFDGALNAVEEKKPKGSTDVHAPTIKVVSILVLKPWTTRSTAH